MSKEKIFKELITEMAKDGEISSSEYAILIEKGKDLGLDKSTVDILIKLELASDSDDSYSAPVFEDSKDNYEESYSDDVIVFKSAITRGGSVLTPDVIEIHNDSIIYKKRNKFLINVDSTTVPLGNISSVKLDTSLWGTDIIITTYGEGKIEVKKFSRTDAKEIARLISERQRKFRR